MNKVENVAYPADAPDRGLWKGLAGFLGAVLLIALIGLYTASDTPQTPDSNAPTYMLQLDCSNAALMHAYGMPTKADVMEYHQSGQWGYKDGDTVRVFDRLPGYTGQWDSLYGIDVKKGWYE